MENYRVGLNHVGSYQVSGVPYVTSSAFSFADIEESVRFQFPNVTKRITFRNDAGKDLRIHFAPYTAGTFDYTNGASGSANYFLILDGAEEVFDVKCKELFISTTNTSTNGRLSICAELTSIPKERMFSLDGVEGVS
jgi:hypothetical protein